METLVEDIVIVGAGIAGLTTSLGLYRYARIYIYIYYFNLTRSDDGDRCLINCRLGVRSLVLESADSLRVTGFALTTWTNAWKALDAVGVGAILRQQHVQLNE